MAIVVLALCTGLAACGDRQKAPQEVETTAVATKAPTSDDASPPTTGAASSELAAMAIDGAPAFAVLYPGAQADGPSVIASGSDGPGGIVTFTTDATPDTVIEFYRQRAEQAGLDPIMAMNQGEARAYGASARSEKGLGLQVVAAPGDDGMTSVQLSWNSSE